MEPVGVYAQTLGFLGKWSACLSQLKLTYGDLLDSAITFAAKSDMWQSQPAPVVMIAYMNAKCGFVVFKLP
jgi:hypothetical protein